MPRPHAARRRMPGRRKGGIEGVMGDEIEIEVKDTQGYTDAKSEMMGKYREGNNWGEARKEGNTQHATRA